jgi:hypothetical protein
MQTAGRWPQVGRGVLGNWDRLGAANCDLLSSSLSSFVDLHGIRCGSILITKGTGDCKLGWRYHSYDDIRCLAGWTLWVWGADPCLLCPDPCRVHPSFNLSPTFNSCGRSSRSVCMDLP